MEKGSSSVRSFLSKRMQRAAQMVTVGNRVADIGCDHAYTSIFLVQEGIAPSAVAMDVREGPIARATGNIRRFGMEERITARLSDGVERLAEGEADTLLLAGMGGLLVRDILSAKPALLNTIQELVLQPQSDVDEVRRFLHRSGFWITEEDMLFEDGKFYTFLRAEHGNEEIYSELEYRYGRYILKQGSPVFLDFLREERQKMQNFLQQMEDAQGERSLTRKQELLTILQMNREACESAERGR